MQEDPIEEYKFKEKLDLREITSQPVEIHQINCPSCTQPIPADNLNIQTNIAKCNSCNGIFSFSKAANRLSTEHQLVHEILQPEGVEINHFKEELDISVQQPWGVLETILLSLLPLLLVMFTSFFIERFPANTVTISTLLALWGTSIAGYIAYFFIRKKHKIYVHIDEKFLSIERRPSKFTKDKMYDIKRIDQIYIKNIISGGTPKGCGIFMIVNDNLIGQQHIELIKSVSRRSIGKYIEQEIEKHLGITDRRVPDEDS